MILPFLLSQVAAGCSDTATATLAGGDDSGGGELLVSPEGPISLGYFQEQAFSVELTGPDGSPLADEPISVSLIGPAHNGYVMPFELTSDEHGSGQVVFTAPDTETQLQIRFSSPAAETDVEVDIDVDPDELGFTIVVDYSGQRPLDQVEASIYADATCDDIAQDGAGDPVEIQSTQSVPASFGFAGLYAGSVYAVQAAGLNAESEVRAAACIDGLLPDGPGGSVSLEDLALDVVGVFGVTTTITTAGSLEPAVDQLAVSLDPFTADVPGAILDGIREVIADEPLVADTFDAIRTTEDLDAQLAADVAAREVDVAASLALVWESVDGGLDEVELAAEVEIGAANQGVHDFYHTIGLLSFEAMDSSYFVAVPETGQATAQAAESDIDLLLVSPHQVGLGLGGPIEFLLGSELELIYGAVSLADAIEEIVDCDAVVALLAAPLSEVADAAEILAGCQGAMLGAETLLDDEVAYLNGQYAQVTFDEGSCRLDDPGEGDLVQAIVEGEFQITWDGPEPLGPMDAVFEGLLQAD